MQRLELTAVIHKAEDGSYWAEVKELPGCFASGFSLDELRDSLVEATILWLESERPEAVAQGEGELGDRLSVHVDEIKLVAG